MHTKDKLAQALTEAGLHDMAAMAAMGYYHDFMSPLALPGMQLDADLQVAGTSEARALQLRHYDGEFDASIEESEQWAASAEGQETFRKLLR